MNTSNLSRFTNLYSISKTLRFELQPLGKTKDYIEKNGILMRDEKRAEDYKTVKCIIDEYQKRSDRVVVKSVSAKQLVVDYYDGYYSEDENYKEYGVYTFMK